jgi:hypothetical protein
MRRPLTYYWAQTTEVLVLVCNRQPLHCLIWVNNILPILIFFIHQTIPWWEETHTIIPPNTMCSKITTCRHCWSKRDPRHGWGSSRSMSTIILLSAHQWVQPAGRRDLNQQWEEGLLAALLSISWWLQLRATDSQLRKSSSQALTRSPFNISNRHSSTMTHSRIPPTGAARPWINKPFKILEALQISSNTKLLRRVMAREKAPPPVALEPLSLINRRVQRSSHRT